MVGLFNVVQYVEETFKAVNQPLKKAEANHSFEGEQIQSKTEPINVLLLGNDSRGEDASSNRYHYGCPLQSRNE